MIGNDGILTPAGWKFSGFMMPAHGLSPATKKNDALNTPPLGNCLYNAHTPGQVDTLKDKEKGSGMHYYFEASAHAAALQTDCVVAGVYKNSQLSAAAAQLDRWIFRH